MVNKKHFLWGIAAFALLSGVIFSACENGTTPDGTQQDITDEERTTVTLLALDESVTAPVVGQPPVTTIEENDQYTGTITWTPETVVGGVMTFQANQAYTAVISLTAKNGYSFEGFASNAVTYRGATITTAASGAQCTITVVFPAILIEAAGIPEYLTGATDEPVSLKLQMELSSANWQGILSALDTANKTVLLDLSACTVSASVNNGGLSEDGVFDPFNADSEPSRIAGKSKIQSLILPTVAISIPDGTYTQSVFANFTGLKNVSGVNIESIGIAAFYNCTSLEEFNFPKATDIGDYAFWDCTSLVEINLPEATSIDGTAAFWDCTGLEKINLPKATSIAVGAFDGCTSLEEINLPEATSIALSAFGGCTSLATVNLPKAITIDAEAFDGCTSLEEINLPKATTIEYGTFSDCSSLVEINLPEATDIGNKAFVSCVNLATVNLPQAITIDYQAFYGCMSLATANLPKAITIGGSAFCFTGATALTVTLGTTPPTLGGRIFYSENYSFPKNVTVKVPTSSLSAYSNGYDNNNTSSNNWGNAFRGKGWNSSTGYGLLAVNTDISLTFVGY